MSVAGASATAAEPRVKRRTRTRGFGPVERVAFPELVWAHALRQRELEHGRIYDGPAEARYRTFESAFERRHGELVSIYWCRGEASAAAVTLKRRPLIFPDEVRLHWATDWATKSVPKLDDLLYECEALGVRIAEVLRDTSQRVAMQWLFTVVSHVLGFAESESCKDAATIDELVACQRAEIAKIEKYYRGAAVRSGQIVYLGGALIGLVPPLLLGFVAWILGFATSTGDTVRIGLACFAAGAVGALVSVMARMNSGRTAVDWEFGKDTLRTMGSLRPFVGAVFGLAAFLALRSGLVSLTLGTDGDRGLAFYILFAFVAGFSERLAQDMLLGSTLGQFSRKPDPPPVAAPADEPTDAVPDGLQPAV